MAVTKDLSSGIAGYLEGVRRGEVSCEERVGAELSSIGGYDGRLNAFTRVFSGQHGLAMARARELDDRGKGDGGPLRGLPVTLKDNIFFGGFPTTDGSAFFRDFIPATNADIADSLLEAGCVPLGKTNLHELALGVTASSALGGPVRNPHDPSRVSGGSSGGSAVSVALAEGPILSVGTDTGGSVRIPAALCGVCGFKPSQGLLSTGGVFPLSSTLDHVGLITKTVDDVSAVLSVLTGVRIPAKRSVRLGVPSSYFTEDMDEAVSRDFAAVLARLRDEPGISLREVETKGDFPRYARGRATIMCKEASWFYEELLRSPSARRGMHADVLSLMDRGLRTGPLQYMEALKVRTASMAAVEAMLAGSDAIIMPTCLSVAPRVDDVLGKETGSVRALLLRNTEPFNTCGFPALSIPMGRGGLPTSLQLVGRFGADSAVLASGSRVWDLLHGGR